MIHIVSEQGKSKWSHIDDLDSFFSKVYEYHQKHGFTVMMLQEVLELLQFIFIVCFTVFLAECVNYPVLFRDKPLEPNDGHKMTLYDVTSYVDFREMSFLTQVIKDGQSFSSPRLKSQIQNIQGLHIPKERDSEWG